MADWLTPIHKIILVGILSTVVGGAIYLAVTNWASENTNKITNPNFGNAIVRPVDEVMA